MPMVHTACVIPLPGAWPAMAATSTASATANAARTISEDARQSHGGAVAACVCPRCFLLAVLRGVSEAREGKRSWSRRLIRVQGTRGTGGGGLWATADTEGIGPPDTPWSDIALCDSVQAKHASRDASQIAIWRGFTRARALTVPSLRMHVHHSHAAAASR